MIKTGILCVPSYDEAAADAVRRLLQRAVDEIAVLQDRHASMQRNVIEDVLCRWCDDEELDLIVTIGGTQPAPGPSQQEIMPEAVAGVAERVLPGLGEAMRRQAEAMTPLALLDRSLGVIRGRTLILALPAGAEAATLFLGPVVGLIDPLLAMLQERGDAPKLQDEIAAGAPAPAMPAKNAPVEKPADSGAGKKALDPAEFEAFLKRRGGSAT